MKLRTFLLITSFFVTYNIVAQQIIDYGPIIDYGSMGRYSLQGAKWNKLSLTYYIYNTSAHLTSSERENAIRNAFNTWQSVSLLSFTQVYSPELADIIVKWATWEHGDNNSFDGPGTVLAHGFFPPPAGGSFAGHLHFDDDENWTVNGSGIDLETVALHEIGHVLGLNHSDDTSAVMYAYYSGIHRTLELDDITGIIDLYSFKINGSSLICDSEMYTAGGGNVQWSTSNTNLQLVSGQGTDTAVFQKVNNGFCSIYAQIQTVSRIVGDTLNVWVGTPTAPSIMGWPHSNMFLANNQYELLSNGNSLAQIIEYEWTVVRGATIIGSNTSNPIITINPRGTVKIGVRARNLCGWGPYTYMSGGITDENGQTPINSNSHNIVSVSVHEEGEYDIQLWNTKSLIRTIKTSQSSYDVDLSYLPSGLYIIKVVKDGGVVDLIKVIR